MSAAKALAELRGGPQEELPADVEALIFDCDGTLVDTMPAHYVAWCAALAPVGLALSEDRFYALAGVTTAAIVGLLAREQGVACDAERVAEDKDARYLGLAHRGDGIAPVVAVARRELGRRKLAVASGGKRDVVLSTLEGAGLAGLFPVVVGAEDVTRGKPAPDVFLAAAARLGVRPERCVVYEDADLGLSAGRAAGMRVVDIRLWTHAAGASR